MRENLDGIKIRGNGYTPHACENCNEDFVGRRNAKFCSTQCKNEFNNNRTRFRDGVIRKYYLKIEMNYKILTDRIEAGKHEISHLELLRIGFQTKFFTSQENFNVEGKTITCNVVCDLALVPINNDNYQIYRHDTN